MKKENTSKMLMALSMFILRIGEGENGMSKVSQMKLWYNLFTHKSSGE